MHTKITNKRLFYKAYQLYYMCVYMHDVILKSECAHLFTTSLIDVPAHHLILHARTHTVWTRNLTQN